MRRYGRYVEEGQPLDAFVETTLKDDNRNDPPITDDALEMLGILSKDEYRTLKALTQKISGIVKDDLATRGIELYDIKLEFGRVGEDRHIALIDPLQDAFASDSEIFLHFLKCRPFFYALIHGSLLHRSYGI